MGTHDVTGNGSTTSIDALADEALRELVEVASQVEAVAIVERAATRRARCERDLRVLVGTEEGLAGPGFCAERVGPHGRRCLRLDRRMRSGF